MLLVCFSPPMRNHPRNKGLKKGLSSLTPTQIQRMKHENRWLLKVNVWDLQDMFFWGFHLLYISGMYTNPCVEGGVLQRLDFTTILPQPADKKGSFCLTPKHDPRNLGLVTPYGIVQIEPFITVVVPVGDGSRWRFSRFPEGRWHRHPLDQQWLPLGTQRWSVENPRGLRLPSTPWWEHSQMSRYGCFQKWWYPQIIHFHRVFHYKPSILGYHYFLETPIW